MLVAGFLLLLATPVFGEVGDSGAASTPEPCIGPAWLGCGEAELREAFGAALRPQPIVRRQVLDPKIVLPSANVAKGNEADGSTAEPPEPTKSATKDPFAEQQLLVRHPESGDVYSVEYQLFRDQVYRVRWKLAERFERPLMTALVARLTAELGAPEYDQLIEAKFGSGRATMQRATWRRGRESLEIRQLNPTVGGPIYLTRSDLTTIQAIVASNGTAAPEPDSIGPWWQKPVKSSAVLKARERDALLAAFDDVLAQVDWKR